MPESYSFRAEVWQWRARSDAWFFVSVPPELSAEIGELPRMPRGFGSVRVVVRIGATSWRTSIFPDAESGTYALPLKRAVRDAEGIGHGDEIAVTIELLD